MKFKIMALAAACAAVFALGGCAAKNEDEEIFSNETIEQEEIFEEETFEEEAPIEEDIPVTVPTPEPKIVKAGYIRITGDSVNIRSGAGTSYSALGTAEKSTLYSKLEKVGEWYKTQYKNKTAYISAKYCEEVEFDKSSDEIEKVIEEGTKCMGVKYVYGAVRLHDGKGNMYKGFTETEFDCSSLMQYIFYKGAGKLLNVNTRTQIYQGTTISKPNLKRGDLIFFTNDSRKNNTGIERVGHVALYLGDNYILHTASDYAKIEQMSAKRLSYFIQAQRVL